MSDNAIMDKDALMIGKEQGIFTLHGVDLKRLYDIEDERSLFVRNMEQFGEYERLEKLKSLLNEMQQILESYQFNDYLMERYVNGFTFYNVLEQIDITEGDLDFCRAGSTIAFTVWRECIRKLGATLPTHSVNSESTKQKIIRRMMSLARGVDEKALIEEYKLHGLRDSNVNFLSYILSIMFRYDLDANIMIVGKARSSKTTLACWLWELIYGYRGLNLFLNERYKKLVDAHYIFDNTTGMTAIKEARKGDVNWFDELYLTFDRRKSMKSAQVETTSFLNFYASNNCVNLFLIQNFTDADQRITTKSTALILVLERGFGMLFSDSKFLPIFRDQFGLDAILDNPSLGKERELALHMLRSMREYICDLNWQPRGAELDESGVVQENGDKIYAYVLQKKIDFQKQMLIKSK